MTSRHSVTLALAILVCSLVCGCRFLEKPNDTPIPVASFPFDEKQGDPAFENELTAGVDKNALHVGSPLVLPAGNFQSSSQNDFSVQLWVKTDAPADSSAVILSKKQFPDKSLASQKNPGWVFYFSGGAWAWNLGSGKLRITHERDNAQTMPLNDGKWHQLTMTHDSRRSEVRLYYDGVNQAIYHLSDSAGFDFANDEPLTLGWDNPQINPAATQSMVAQGREMLQELVDEFNRLGVGKVAPDEFVDVIADPKALFEKKVHAAIGKKSARDRVRAAAAHSADLGAVMRLRSNLMDNPYTTHQVPDFLEVAPLLKIYSLSDDSVQVHTEVAKTYATRNTLSAPAFHVDQVSLWNSVLSAKDVSDLYGKYNGSPTSDAPEQIKSLTAAVWNIHHGGIHNAIEADGWDSRMRIVEMLKAVDADVIMMQETYSNGDFIAAELGYHFATSMDIDYLNQGTNISVLSRYPIREVYVPKGAAFMNVGCKIALSPSQDIFVMSNWYGMHKFNDVFDFYRPMIAQTDSIPMLFGGDFNAVPHTDGGDSPASVRMIQAGFTDSYRSAFPDVKKYPGASHENNKRIDQLYYKGSGLKASNVQLINTWPSGFPSDHYLLVTSFDAGYTTLAAKPR